MYISGCTVNNVQGTSLIFSHIFFPPPPMVGFRTQKYAWGLGGGEGGLCNAVGGSGGAPTGGGPRGRDGTGPSVGSGGRGLRGGDDTPGSSPVLPL